MAIEQNIMGNETTVPARDRFLSVNITPRWFVYSIVLSVFLVPTIRIGESVPAIRLEEILVFFWLGLVMLTISIRVKIQLALPVAYLSLGALFAIYVFISIFWGGALGYGPVAGDFMEVVKAVKYLLIIVIVAAALGRGTILRRDLLNLIGKAGLITVMVAVTQYVNLFGLNNYYVPYIAPTQYMTLVDDYPWPRVVGLTSNPNEYAALSSLASLAVFYQGLFYNKRSAWLIWPMLVGGIILTLSRSGFIFLALSSVMLFIRFLQYHRWRLKYGSAILPLVCAGVVAAHFLPEQFYTRFELGLDFQSRSSGMGNRLENWEERKLLFQSHPWFGVGPAKAIEFDAAPDNEWLLLGMRYGVLGVVLFLLWLLVPLFKRSNFNRHHTNFIALYGAATVGAFAYMIPAGIYHSLQVFPALLLFGAMASPAEYAKRIG